MNKLVKNWSYLFVSDLSQAVISFFVFMFLARKLTPEGYGTLNAILALVSLFSVFATSICANQVIIREVTLQPKASLGIFKVVLPIKVISLLISIFALLLYQFYTKETQAIVLISTSVIVIATLIADLSESIAFGHFVTKFTTILSISAAVCWLLVIVLLPNNKISVNLVLLVYSIIYLVRSMAYLGISFGKFVRPNIESAGLRSGALLLMSMPFLWMRIVGVFSDQVPLLLLKGFGGAAEVGFYAVGNRFVFPITMAVSTGLRAVFPFLTKLYHEAKEKFVAKLADGFNFVLILGSTIAMVLTISSSVWIPLFFGEAYEKSIAAFNYQAWLGVLICFDMILANVLTSTYRQKVLAIIMTIDILIVFPLMYLGAQHGAEGMAIAKLAGAFITVLYHVVVVIKVLKAGIKSFSFLLSCIYFIVMMCATIFINEISIKVTIVIVLLMLFTLYRNSPLRSAFRLALKYIFKQLTKRELF